MRHRWSFGAGRRPWGFVDDEWGVLLDPPVLLDVLTEIYGGGEFLCCGAGGDFCLPGAVEYQPLHSDIGPGLATKLEVAEGDPGYVDGGMWTPSPDFQVPAKPVSLDSPELPGKRYVYDHSPINTFHDPSHRLDLRDLPTTFIAVNFPLTLGTDEKAGHSHVNGATRQVPGTMNSKAPPPSLEEEPDWMRFNTVSPARAGAAMIRDIRAWHGGTVSPDSGQLMANSPS